MQARHLLLLSALGGDVPSATGGDAPSLVGSSLCRDLSWLDHPGVVVAPYGGALTGR
jgi:hypothetical protein